MLVEKYLHFSREQNFMTRQIHYIQAIYSVRVLKDFIFRSAHLVFHPAITLFQYYMKMHSAMLHCYLQVV